MLKSVFIITVLGLLYLPNVLCQSLEVEGKAKITLMDLVNTADTVVVRLTDGTLATRDVASILGALQLDIVNDTIKLSNGSFIILPVDQVDDADADPTNEIETWTTLTGKPSGFSDDVDDVDDADADPTNESLTQFTVSGDTLYVTESGTQYTIEIDSSNMNEIQNLAEVLTAGSDAGNNDMVNIDSMASKKLTLSMPSSDVHLNIISDGGNTSVSGVKLRHSSNDYGFTIESDDKIGSQGLNIRRHYGSSTGISDMFIDVNGQVGIGTTSPVHKMDINGDLAVDGLVKVAQMDTSENEELLVVKKADGTLATRTIKSLPPDPPDTIRNLETDFALAKLLCDCGNDIPPFLVQSTLDAGYSIMDLYSASVPISNFSDAGVSVQELLDGGLTPCNIFEGGLPLDSLYGKMYAGGLIFYLDTVSCNGFVSAPNTDQGFTTWGCYQTDLPNVPNVTGGLTGPGAAIGEGMMNTDSIIVNGCILATDAARLCSDLSLNGYTDWFLPSIGELELMYLNLHLNGFGVFVTSRYWSSSEKDADTAHRLNFGFGNIDSATKFNNVTVRAIREFNGS